MENHFDYEKSMTVNKGAHKFHQEESIDLYHGFKGRELSEVHYSVFTISNGTDQYDKLTIYEEFDFSNMKAFTYHDFLEGDGAIFDIELNKGGGFDLIFSKNINGMDYFLNENTFISFRERAFRLYEQFLLLHQHKIQANYQI